MADIKKPRVTFDEEGITASKPAPAVGGAGAPSAADSAAGAADPDFGLMKQDLSKLDVSTLTPLTPEIISRQATINIGTIGHVAHGKSTVVRSISGVKVSARGDGLALARRRATEPPPAVLRLRSGCCYLTACWR